jgi:hypothetical protein
MSTSPRAPPTGSTGSGCSSPPYTNHYRTGLIQILEVLGFGSTNTVHAPMMEALAPIKRCKEIWVAGVIEEGHSVKLFPGRRARINPVADGLFICQELHGHVPKDTPDLPGIS